MENHIRVKRMWQYVQQWLELTTEELAHISECKTCLSLFKLCALADPSTDLLNRDSGTDNQSQKKSA